jgi:hypothetical protein
MVDHCANPKCAKPLHYLREGRIFVFDVNKDAGGKSVRRVEHYWLCGPCAQTYALERTIEGIRLMPKKALPVTRPVDLPAPPALAS